MKKLSTLFVVLFVVAGTALPWDHEQVLIDDLYYNLDDATQTAEVTYMPDGKYKGSIAIPKSVVHISTTYQVTSIGDWAFMTDTLTSVLLPDGITSIGNQAFERASLISINIPNSVVSIGGKAFWECTSLTKISIPKSVTSIEDCAFNRCTDMTEIEVSLDNPNYCSCDGVLFNKSLTLLITCPAGKQGEYTIPNNVSNIERWAFERCFRLTTINIPNNVTSIGDMCFYECFALTNITIPNSVTELGDWLFAFCSKLTNVILPNSIIGIGAYSFYNCNALTSIAIPSNYKFLGEYAFGYCKGLTKIFTEAIVPPNCGQSAFEGVDKTIPLYVPDGSVDKYKEADQWKDFKNIKTNIPSINQYKKSKKVNKSIVNGQVIIERDDQAYNIVGARVK